MYLYLKKQGLTKVHNSAEVAVAFHVTPHCKRCLRELDQSDIAGDGLVFGLCSVCLIVETKFHTCGNCDNGTAAPGKELCFSCFEILKG